MRPITMAVVGFTLAVAIPIMLVASASRINKWEQRHNYPYGKMCDSIFSGGVDTCKRPVSPWPAN